jgi:hypothetical protein
MKKLLNRRSMYVITVIYIFFGIGARTSPTPFRKNIFTHIVYFSILIIFIIINIRNRKK